MRRVVRRRVSARPLDERTQIRKLTLEGEVLLICTPAGAGGTEMPATAVMLSVLSY